jgi:multiple sugar transport system substrate-binding protein
MRSAKIYRLALGLGAVSLLAAACTATDNKSDEPIASPTASASGQVSFWHFFTGREASAIDAVVKDFETSHPGITVKVSKGQDDEKMRQAISAGKGPDVGLSYSTDIVGNFCTSGAWRDLNPYITRDKVDMNQLAPVVRSYTEYKGTRCSMPVLADTYGLYYNKKLLADAGYTEPPKTLSQLAEMAKKMTTHKANGDIDVIGFMPFLDYYENSPAHWAPHWAATWFDQGGKSALATDPAWAAMLTWQKQLVDFYGSDKLTKFSAGKGDEFSAANDFERGKVAMMLDGEWRIAFIDADKPNLDYGTAPFPPADDKQNLYGGGYVTGNIVGISRGSDNPEAAWELIKYLTTDTGAIVKLANGIKNVPTTQAALASPDLQVDDKFKTFLDIFANPNSATSPSTANGAEYQTLFGTWLVKWQTGRATDLQAGLESVAKQIDDSLSLGTGS